MRLDVAFCLMSLRAEILARTAAGLMVLAILALIGTNVWGSLVVESHDPVANTVSELAVGRGALIQDSGLVIYAAGLLILAVAISQIPGTRRLWRWGGSTSFMLMAAATALIALRHEYGDGDSEAPELHMLFVYALSLSLILAPLSLHQELQSWSRPLARANLGFLFIWIAASPGFFIVPDAYDGAYERALLFVSNLWVAMVAYAIFFVSVDAKKPRAAPEP
ncbi:MAG: DUF998 domain-containing protein [Pseudomonadota bacterium]